MEQKTGHRRLQAFYRSKVLNALIIVVIVSLLLMAYTKSMLMPVICGTMALLFFIGYSLWLWIKKPKSIIVNDRLSNITVALTLYYLIIMTIDASNQWWFIAPMAFSVVILFITLTNNKDEIFDCTAKST